MGDEREAVEAPDDIPTLVGQPPSVDDSAPSPSSSAGGGRYVALRDLGRGGMGFVQLVHDTKLGRPVALKTVLRKARSDETRLLRFLAEAKATAQLEHPSIVPVYDLTENDRGEPCFTMRFVEGRSLAQILAGLRRGDADTVREHGPSELLRDFLKVCDAVAYAHDRGVVHRDLKPDNVMIGRFGEVFVMDWGLVGARSDSDPAGAGPSSSIELAEGSRAEVSGVETKDQGLTLAGSIVGTPGYIPPEQIRGDPAPRGAAADVFALGAILYEILTHERAIEGNNVASILANTLLANITPPRGRARGALVPPGLEAITLRALAPLPHERFESAAELRTAVAHELEGSREAERRRARAHAKLELARDHVAGFRALVAEHRARAEAAQTARATLPVERDDETREAVWGAEGRASEVLAEARRAFWDAYGALVAATREDPGLDAPREALVELLLDRAIELRSGGDRDGALDLEAIARQHDPERAADRLDRAIRVDLDVDPPAERITVARFVTHGPVLRELVDSRLEPRSQRLALPPGDYVIALWAPERAEVRVPLSLAPRAPARRIALRLPHTSEVGEGFVLVPGGTWRIGGDRAAAGAEGSRLVELGPFAIGRHLVTVREYARFLDHLAARDPSLAQKHVPSLRGMPCWLPERDGHYRAPYVDANDGDTIGAELPVTMLAVDDAVAYAAWAARETGLALRLPTSEEWEVAARGGLERAYVWGDGFDPTLCWMRESPGPMRPHPVGTAPFDRSVFGVLDMAGNVREATSSRVLRTGHVMSVVRGGAWQSPPDQCRIGRRAFTFPDRQEVTVGFRLAYSIAP